MTPPSGHAGSAWRIGTDTPDYEANDLSGKGAEKSGGRWNRMGTPMVYAASSRALACLETVVHLSAVALPLNRYLVELVFPEEAWKAAVVVEPALVVGWDALPAGRVSMNWGSAWVQSGVSLMALVPSVIVPEEYNVLVNPFHSDVGKVKAIKRRRWNYDARLWGAS